MNANPYLKHRQANTKGKKTNPYLVQKVLSASPEELILYIYDAAIAACGNSDQSKAAEAIQELINALNFEKRTVANTFYQMYQHILHLIHNNKFNRAKELIREIRDTWAQAMKLE
ncbi:MAG: flagellar protein FliS [Candidatus Marinimicrobia bacterium]|nr:flagellar protein FliS [Candidatus Neomarinimicrobiota bacterium]